MSKHFCCCIPVRFGAFVISLLGLIFSSLGAFSVWWTLTHQGHANIITLQSGAKPPFVAQGIYLSMVAIASFIGLIGALARKRGLIAFYSGFLWASMIMTAALGIWAIIKVAGTFDDSALACKTDLKNALNSTLHGDTTNNTTTHNDCISAPVAKATFITAFSLVLFIQLYGTIVVYRYKKQLDDKKRWDAAPNKRVSNLPETSYRPVSTGDRDYTYPYADPKNSYGHSGV